MTGRAFAMGKRREWIIGNWYFAPPFFPEKDGLLVILNEVPTFSVGTE
jgi:hypothetical protein